MKIALLPPTNALEKRVPLMPEGIKKLKALGYTCTTEQSYGQTVDVDPKEWTDAGLVFHKKMTDAVEDADILLCVQPLSKKEIDRLSKKTLVLGPLKPALFNVETQTLATSGLTSFTLDLIPRITRAQSMDILSSQSNLAGYRAVIEGASRLSRIFPMMMTPAGTIPPARVLILGAGVAGLQAIATAKRLGAIVSAFDVRDAAKEQVESLGATFISVENSAIALTEGHGGYAQEMHDDYKKAQRQKLMDVLKTQDLVITTAQIPLKRAPVLLDLEMLSVMKRGSLVIDLASETGGNCTLTKAGDIIEHNGVTLQCGADLLSKIATDASLLFSRNMVHFITNLLKEGTVQWDDDIVKGTLLTKDGAVVHPLLLNNDAA